MPFKITIQETKVEPRKSREYRKISDTGGDDNKGKYGYVDEVKEEEIITTIFEQRIAEINLEAILKAVNDIR